MNRNTQAHFAELPTVDIGRSKFDRSFTHKTTFNTGELVPVYVDMDIVPGDTVKMRQAELIRMTTPIAPVMDNCFADFYWFFVPNRLVYLQWKNLMGENDTAPWTIRTEYKVPQLKIDNSAISRDDELVKTHDIEKGSLLNHMGIPITSGWTGKETKDREIQISSLPTKAYCLIWNEFFRDENLQNPLNITKGTTDLQIVNSKHASYISDPDAAQVSYEQYGGLPCMKVCKPHDYFTSALPQAQKGPAVTLPLAGDTVPLVFKEVPGTAIPTNSKGKPVYGYMNNSTIANLRYINNNDTVPNGSNTQSPIESTTLSFVGIEADLTKATGATVTALRQAFAIQKFYERDARGGTRYIESIKSHFGVTNPDFRFQRPEYLGGFRHNINMNQIVQSNGVVENTEATPLGTTGAYSATANEESDVFTHSFTEHGILMGLICVRTDHTYQQGINRSWFKKSRLDFYSPEFANLSEQAILNQEIYAQGTSDDKDAFGYQEAWAEMRYMPDMVTGELSSLYDTPLDIWHYADYYTEKPTLGNKWIKETDVNVARTLAIQDQDQFIADFYFGAIYTRPMPLYSIPGLIDHH